MTRFALALLCCFCVATLNAKAADCPCEVKCSAACDCGCQQLVQLDLKKTLQKAGPNPPAAPTVCPTGGWPTGTCGQAAVASGTAGISAPSQSTACGSAGGGRRFQPVRNVLRRVFGGCRR